MCLIFVSLKSHSSYKLIVAANRDEFYNRNTAAATFWRDHPQILGGRDLEAGGTWLGMSRSGKVSMITNYRDPKNIDPKAPSRGYLVSDYLKGSQRPSEFLHELEPHAKQYNGFNLLMGTPEELWYFSNYGTGIQKLEPGKYALSNHLLDTPWPKVQKVKEKINKVIAGRFTDINLFEALYNDEVAADELLPDTGIGLERERALSSIFIKSPGYGTRCSTVILVDNDNNVSFTERVYELTSFSFSEQKFAFKI
jgi:uncharacterized protein with NRDE domain